MYLRPSRGPGRCFLSLAFAALLAAAGCGGSSRGTVTGKVYYKDKLLKGGNVYLVRADGQAASGVIEEDGTFTVLKAPVGEVTVTVETASLKPRPKRFQYKAPPNEAGYKLPDYNALAKRYVPIPDKYADPKTSGMTLTVKGGKQEQDIKLP